MISDELYCKGAKVWVEDVNEVWKGAFLLEDWKLGKPTLLLELEGSSEVRELRVLSREKLPPLRNPEQSAGPNDLSTMTYLNEPEVLYNLKIRFSDRSQIYTNCGIVLVAVNPYKSLPIYENEVVQEYKRDDCGSLPPHIYAVAKKAFDQLSRFEQNQSIIVSGESGAGKTVSAKYAMRYFAIVGGSSYHETQVEKILASNPIMEAFGNAKTTRNDNSSRFGKYIHLDFEKNFTMVGASMKTYLLERSRVVFQAAAERNYHIFYQLCASRELPELSELQLTSAEEFLYLYHGKCSVVDGTNDSEESSITKNAFKTLGVCQSTQRNIYKVLAAILHLGNIGLNEKKADLGRAVCI